jgi:alpha-L-fucosidase 2
MQSTYTWEFPLKGAHTGVLLGNGVAGAMIWGERNILCITLNRADFWDHRGGREWSPEMKFDTIRELLSRGDEQRLRAIFEGEEPSEGMPQSPSLLPLGRLEVIFPEKVRLVAAKLAITRGIVEIEALDSKGESRTARIAISRTAPVIVSSFPESLQPELVRRVSAHEFIGKKLASLSIAGPEMFEKERFAGWVQSRPADEPLCAGYRFDVSRLGIALTYGKTVEEARDNAERLVDEADAAGDTAFYDDVAQWWQSYWADMPSVDIPNDTIQTLYEYGMYKFACYTAPDGAPGTLQGPWIEEFRMPPWSSDYHFNINVQMCYWPAYQSGKLEFLRPLFDMIWSWRDSMRTNAELFVGVKDGYLLPHSVDDRCVITGAFWTGTIDHACTAWVGKMMYDYWLYGGDELFLRETAYPFMVGAMRVYEEMLDREADGFVLPVSVSPEYRGNGMDAWGRNASFQLGAIHWLIEALHNAAAVLGETPKPLWAEIQKGLPKACVESPEGQQKIMLWHGTDLQESHRHHSHLAGLYPWDSIDLRDDEWNRIFAAAYMWWFKMGMGKWSGWCIPWAAMLHARAGSPDMAEALLEYFDRLYTNEGHGTLHDFQTFGENLQTNEYPATRNAEEARMQIDAGMAAAAATLDFLVQVRRGVHYLFEGAPVRWRRVGFENIRTEGAFTVSARRVLGVVSYVRIVSRRNGELRLSNPWPAALRKKVRAKDGKPVDSAQDIIALSMKKNEILALTVSD